MKKIICLLLALCMLLPVCAVTAGAEETGEEDFVPAIRFVVCSDTHVRDDNDVTTRRIGKMMELAYGLAEEDAAYPALDALLVAGDLTNDGTKTEFDKFMNAVNGALRGDTRFLGVVPRNHDGYLMPRAEMRAYYESVSGNDADFHVVINGYHFIGISVSKNAAERYDAGQLIWMRKQLDAAVKDDPDRPIFVMHHEHVLDTVYGSSIYDGWGVPHFNALLARYPQVVDFSGHSHDPLNDPRSLWQGTFTASGTGAIYYSEFTVDSTRTYHPADSNDTATCWIVELDAANRMRLRGMDVEAGACLCEYVLENPANLLNRPYTPAARKLASRPPVFSEDAALTAAAADGGCTVTVPVAASADGMPVVLYRAWAKDGCGLTLAKTWTLPCYYRAVEQTEVELRFEGLPAGEYTITVVAENAYGGQSEPLETTFTMESEDALGFFGRIALWFRLLFERIKDLFY